MLAASALRRDGLLFVATVVAAWLVTPWAMRLALRLGIVDRPAPNKFHRRTTPYLGGLAVALSVIGGLVVAFLAEPTLRLEFGVIALGAAAVSGIGLLDDWATLDPMPRIAVQSLAAIGLWAAGIRLGPTGVAPVDLALTVLAVLAITNAVNLLDNMDGLSTGTVAIASVFVFVASYWQGQRLVSLMAIALAGGSLGFLPYNFNPARIFLGDAGSLFMGFLLATAVIELDLRGYPLVIRAVVPLLLIAVPLFDMTLVVVSRRRAGRPVLQGGTDHSSHRLVALGATPKQAALVTYGAAALSGGIALGLLRARSEALTWVVLAAGAALAAALIWRFERVLSPGLRLVSESVEYTPTTRKLASG